MVTTFTGHLAVLKFPEKNKPLSCCLITEKRKKKKKGKVQCCIVKIEHAKFNASCIVENKILQQRMDTRKHSQNESCT